MTREDAISIMNVIVHMLEPQYDTGRIEDAVEMAIDALKQEPFDIDQYCKEHGYILCEKGTEKKVLDDIKAEIEKLKPHSHYTQEMKNKVIEIIDKHMKEGE